jgi:hypothetical protein
MKSLNMMGTPIVVGGGENLNYITTHVPHASCPVIPFMVATITRQTFSLSHKGTIHVDAIGIPTGILNR